MKKILLLMCLALLTLPSFGAGTWIGDLSYNLNSSTLTAEVTYSTSYPPSNLNPSYPSLSGHLDIPETVEYGGKVYKVTSIGDNSFCCCSGLTSINIPTSIKSINDYTFYNCSGLQGELIIPNSVTSIGNYAFSYCSGLQGELIIPDAVTSIGASTFYHCSGLTSVTIPNSVTSIGAQAFCGCGGLQGELTIPNSVKSIGNYAFSGCIGLTSIIINSVTSMGHYAFSGCAGLTSIIFGDSVHSIGERAFYSCNGLKSVTIPNSITSIGSGAFKFCKGLTDFVVEDGDSELVFEQESLDGAPIENLYLGRNCNIYEKTNFSSSLTYLTIGNGVTQLPNKAFYNFSKLTSITISNSVTSIGASAFYNCGKLTSVTIPNSVTTIGASAFYNCSKLTDFVVEDGDTELVFGQNALYGAPIVNLYLGRNWTYSGTESISTGISKATIGNRVTKLPDKAFYNCKKLDEFIIEDGDTELVFGQDALYGVWIVNLYLGRNCNIYKNADFYYLAKVTIGNGVTQLPDKAFYNCSKLKDFVVEDGDTELVFGQDALYLAPIENLYLGRNWTYSGTESISTGISKASIGNRVTKLPDKAFYNCSKLTDFVIEDGDAELVFGQNALYGSPIVNLYLGRNCNIYENADFSSLAKVTIGNGVTQLPDKAFYNCSKLTSITIPNSVTSIGNSAFYSCSGLTGELNIPNSVTSIGNSAFYNCRGLTSITIPNSVTSIGSFAFYSCSGLKKVEISDIAAWCKIRFSTIDSNPLRYAGHLYMKGEEISNLVIPESITAINNYAFYSCSGLTSVTIPNSVTSIGHYAFKGCRGLTSIPIPISVTSIGDDAFDECYGLKKVEIFDIAAWCKIDFSNFFSNPLSFALHLYMDGKEIINLVIPESITAINDYAFQNCVGLTSINIPSSVTSIGDYSFSGCHGLTSVSIPSSVTTIGDYAFSGCSGLTSFAIPNSVTSIGRYAFYSCSGLKDFGIEDGDTELNIVQNALNGAPIENLYIGRNWTFSGTESMLKGLDNVTIGTRVTKVPDYAFGGCTELTDVAIPSWIKEIGDNAFNGCTGLKSIAMGANIEKVGANVLNGCNNVKDIHVTALEAPKASDNTVSDYSATLWVTPGVENSYYDALGCWWKFNNVKKLIVPTSFTANRTDFSGKVGDQFRLRGIFEPADVTLPYVFYTSSDRTVATVDATGLVTILDDQRSCEITLHNLYADTTVNAVTLKIRGALNAIEDVVVDGNQENFGENESDVLRVYNLQGMRMNVSDRQGLRSLPRGVYIVNGKKELVR